MYQMKQNLRHLLFDGHRLLQKRKTVIISKFYEEPTDSNTNNENVQLKSVRKLLMFSIILYITEIANLEKPSLWLKHAP